VSIALLNIPTTDFERSLPFYAQLLKIDPSEFIKNTHSKIEQYHYPVSGDGLDLSVSQKNDTRDTTIMYFAVDDLGRTIDDLCEAGGKLIMDPRNMPEENGAKADDKASLGKTALMVDPDGNYIGLMELTDEQGQRYFRQGPYAEEMAGLLRERIELAQRGATAS
jgi:predicted enzyme related to lactoylglutathione lyase